MNHGLMMLFYKHEIWVQRFCEWDTESVKYEKSAMSPSGWSPVKDRNLRTGTCRYWRLYQELDREASKVMSLDQSYTTSRQELEIPKATSAKARNWT